MRDIFDQYGGLAMGVVTGIFCMAFLYGFMRLDDGMIPRLVLEYIGMYLGGGI